MDLFQAYEKMILKLQILNDLEIEEGNFIEYYK